MKSARRRPNSPDQIGESIHAHRLIVDSTQDDLAHRLDVSLQRIQQYQKSANRADAGRLPRIARLFAVEFSDGEVSH
jgi:transcriptional regulator with XRE-family HTH domain